MKNILSIFIVIVFANYSCNTPVNSPETGNNIADSSLFSSFVTDSINSSFQPTVTITDDYFLDPVIYSYQNDKDTLYVSEDCIIFIWPDSSEIEEIKKLYPDSYEQILTSRIATASEIAIILDSLNVKNFYSDKSVLWFKGFNKDFLINKKQSDAEMIFYKLGKEPLKFKYKDFRIDFVNDFFELQSSEVEI